MASAVKKTTGLAPAITLLHGRSVATMVTVTLIMFETIFLGIGLITCYSVDSTVSSSNISLPEN